RRSYRPPTAVGAASAATSKSDSIPERVFRHPAHEPGTDRVRHDVARDCLKIVFPAQRPIVVPPRPQSAGPSALAIHGMRTASLQDPRADAERPVISELQQAMRV